MAMLPVPYPRQDEAIPRKRKWGPSSSAHRKVKMSGAEKGVESPEWKNLIVQFVYLDAVIPVPGLLAPRPRPGTSTRNSPSLGK